MHTSQETLDHALSHDLDAAEPSDFSRVEQI
jgi:hypothetical protein